jgi:teichuronic acid exporter
LGRSPGPMGANQGPGLFGGFAWLAAAGFITKAATLGAHIVLGWLLSPDEFGLYALAAGLYVLLQGLQSGGIRVALVSRGRAAAARELKNALLISAVTHLLIASSLWAGAPAAASIYGEPRLASLLRTMAVAVALNISWVAGGAVLQNRQQFRRLAAIELTDGVTKAVLTIAFATAGLGAMSLVLPLPFLALFRALAGLHAVACEWHPEQRPAREAGRLAQDGGWIVAATLAHALLTQGDYLGLGLTLPTSILGIYYFAYQVPGQLGPLLASKLGDVLVPGLVARRKVGQRMVDLVEPVAIQFSTVLTLVGCVLAAVFPYLETILWRGRWESAVAPGQVLSLLIVLWLLHVIPKSILQAQRRFAALFFISLFGGFGVIGLAAGLGAMTTNLTAVAVALGAYLSAVTTVLLVVAVRGTDVNAGRIIRQVSLTWLVAVGTTGVIIGTQRWFDDASPWIALPMVSVLTAGAVAGSWRFLAPAAYYATCSLVLRLSRARTTSGPRGSHG